MYLMLLQSFVISPLRGQFKSCFHIWPESSVYSFSKVPLGKSEVQLHFFLINWISICICESLLLGTNFLQLCDSHF